MDNIQWAQIASISEQVTRKYYQEMDTQRGSLFVSNFMPNGCLMWNGKTMKSQEIQGFYNQLAKSQTNILSLSAQPLNRNLS